MSSNILIAGAGIFGATAALELLERGHDVTIVDPGPIPHPLAASTDISKVVRMEYGADEDYMTLMEDAHRGWLAWNEAWRADGTDALYHDTGVLMICHRPMAPGGFEYDSWQLLEKRGHDPVRLDSAAIAERFPAWRADRYVDGFYHAKGGYAESGRVVAALVERAVEEGAHLVVGERITSLLEHSGRVNGACSESGEIFDADCVVLAAGAWTAKIVPALHASIAASGHPVFHMRPHDPLPFQAERFPTFTADVSQTGYYGFPVNPDGVVKIANHGLGSAVDADGERTITGADHDRLQRFLRDTFPALADAQVVYARLCLYTDTQDEHFWIARDPERLGVVVASGGSGHGFKFAPVLGGLIADAVEGHANRWLDKFSWRPELRMAQGQEAARCHIEDDDPRVDDNDGSSD